MCDINQEPDESNNFLDIVSSSASALSGISIPDPIKKNLFKALGQLCTAVVDVPIAHLEGVAAEKRAETDARIKIISKSAKQIVEKIDVSPEYADAATKKYAARIIKEQINIDKISSIAIQDIQASYKEVSNIEAQVTAETSISDDWLNTFEKEASQKSSDEMHLLFGRILAGEIKQPSSFSIRTIKLLSQLDNQAAILFHKLCSLCICLKISGNIYDARVVSLEGNAASNSLAKYGLNFDQLNILHEYGLIIPDYNSNLDYGCCIVNEQNQASFAMTYQGKHYVLLPISKENFTKELKLDGVQLSKSGKELLNIVDITPEDSYTEDLVGFFEKRQLNMKEI